MMDNKSSCCQKLLACVLISVLFTVRSKSIQETKLNTMLGSLTGKIDQVEIDGQTKDVTSFLGIPYAKPPVHERRFARPEQHGDLKGFPTYNATFYRPHCIQTYATYNYMKHFKESEDCLYLNVFVPRTPVNGSFYTQHSHRYSVMIYIHGGSFAAGGADIYTGDKLSLFGDVIIVTINYRLNVFGFLSNGGKYSGNYGLWDMKLAIQWVHDNIEAFGGDPSRVTLFGNSAGGAAVLYQAINPNNRGLFQRIIAQSGSCFAFWALQDNPARNFNWFTAYVGCNQGNYTESLKCLRKKPVDSVTLGSAMYMISFVPAVDQDFLMEDPVSLSARRTAAGRDAMDFLSELDLLNGVASQDGAYAIGRWEKLMVRLKINGVTRAYFVDTYIPMMLGRMYDSFVPPVLTEWVVHQYTDWSRPDDTVIIRDRLIDFESDVTFFIPALHASQKHVEISDHSSPRNNNSYFYVFHHKPGFAPEPKWLTGATHVMELPYIFGFSKAMEVKLQMDYRAVNPFITSDEDIQFSKELMTFWANFAKTGNPSKAEDDSVANLEWPPYTLDTQLYLELTPNMTSQSVKHHFAASRVAFWENIVPMLHDCNSGCISCYISTSNCLIFFLFVVLDYFERI